MDVFRSVLCSCVHPMWVFSVLGYRRRMCTNNLGTRLSWTILIYYWIYDFVGIAVKALCKKQWTQHMITIFHSSIWVALGSVVFSDACLHTPPKNWLGKLKLNLTRKTIYQNLRGWVPCLPLIHSGWVPCWHNLLNIGFVHAGAWKNQCQILWLRQLLGLIEKTTRYNPLLVDLALLPDKEISSFDSHS